MRTEAEIALSPMAARFSQVWPIATSDSNVTLHGFQRFKTTHLINLRLLEKEIAEMDRKLYQAGLSLGHDISATDRLGLGAARRDPDATSVNETITVEFVEKLRRLIRQYDESLLAFSNVLALETVSLLDDVKKCSKRTDLTLYEMYKTRLVRIDMGVRSRTDPFQRWIHKQLRAFHYWRIKRRLVEPDDPMRELKFDDWSHQNTVLVAGVTGRIFVALVTGAFLVVPLGMLSSNSVRGTQLVVVAVAVLVFSFLVAGMLKVSNYEMMVVAAAYAAVLSVFVSNEQAG